MNAIKIFQEIAGEHGFELSQQECKEMVKIMNETIETIGKSLEVKESCNLGVVKVEKKKRAARKGKSILDGKEVEWTSPKKVIIALSAKKSFEKDTETIKGE